jgi:hypothetical protein
VCKQFGVTSAEYVDGEIFQPVPWSPNTPHGMPLHFEQYLHTEDVSARPPWQRCMRGHDSLTSVPVD